MKKNLFAVWAMLFFFLLLLQSCSKDFNHNSSCRLTLWQGVNDDFLRSFSYNSQGLVSEWHESALFYGADELFTFEYTSNKKLASMKYYNFGIFYYDVIYVYKNGRITEEHWFLEDGTLDDISLNTYNAKGQIIKRESINYGYYGSFVYDAIGNVLRADMALTDGTLIQSEIFGFDKPVLEPMNTVAGLPYAVPYTNYSISKLKHTHYKVLAYDETGTIPFTIYEYDPAQSILETGPGAYPSYFYFYDIISQTSNTELWTYDNCDGDTKVKDKGLSRPFVDPTISGKTERPRYFTLKQMKDRVKAKRAQKTN